MFTVQFAHIVRYHCVSCSELQWLSFAESRKSCQKSDTAVELPAYFSFKISADCRAAGVCNNRSCVSDSQRCRLVFSSWRFGLQNCKDFRFVMQNKKTSRPEFSAKSRPSGHACFRPNNASFKTMKIILDPSAYDIHSINI